MPKILDRRMVECGDKLASLFAKISMNDEIATELKALHVQYTRLLIKDSDRIKSYELFLSGVESIDSSSDTLQKVLNDLEEIGKEEKIGVVLYNVLKALEQLFWLAAAGACVAIAIMASPVLAMDPYTATVVMTLLCAQLLASIINIMNCFSEYKSFTPVNERLTREKDLLTFFSKSKAQPINGLQPQVQAQNDEQVSDDDQDPNDPFYDHSAASAILS